MACVAISPAIHEPPAQCLPRPEAGPTPAATCTAFLHDAASGNTFRIPSVPATSTVAHLKQWFSKNIAPTPANSLRIHHNNVLVNDTTPFWQLAAGTPSFSVTASRVPSSPRALLNLTVGLPALPSLPALSITISNDSTVLYLKQRLYESLNLSTTAAAAAVVTVTGASGCGLPDASTLLAAGLNGSSNALSLALPPSDLAELSSTIATSLPAPRPRTPPSPLVTKGGSEYEKIAAIWNAPSSHDSAYQSSNTSSAASSPPSMTPAPPQPFQAPSALLLPQSLLDDEDDMPSPVSSSVTSSLPSSRSGSGEWDMPQMRGIPQQCFNPAQCPPCNPAPQPGYPSGLVEQQLANGFRMMQLQQLQLQQQQHAVAAANYGNLMAPQMQGSPAPQHQRFIVQQQQQQQQQQQPRQNSHTSFTSDQLQHLAANFRTKLCRNGRIGRCCKFGRNCWFAHSAEEMRKPSDPLPNYLPAVHKLERYSHREGNKQDRTSSQ